MQLSEHTYFGENNRYCLERLLGRGGFSEVWLAQDNLTHQQIALKVYVPGTGLDDEGLQTFSEEFARVSNLRHQNLLTSQHVDAWKGMPYLTMSYCAQGSLVKKIGKMSEQEIRKVLHDVASGLAYLHAHDVIHQDIKPDNILLDDAGNYVITDFGISTRTRSTLRKSVAASSSHSGGTIAYMGPERFGKEPAPVKASDIWSLGAMLYELMTGDTPFGEHGGLIQKSGAEIPTIQGNWSDDLKHCIEQMLAPNPWDRLTAADLAISKFATPPTGGRRLINLKENSKYNNNTQKTTKKKIIKLVSLLIGCFLLAFTIIGVFVTYVYPFLIFQRQLSNAKKTGEWVDLGLSVKWATCNIGAKRPKDKGNDYDWGAVVPFCKYDYNTYRLTLSMTPNRYKEHYKVLEPGDDAATYNWGNNWRIPTKEEWQELIENCTWVLCDDGHEMGYKVVASNGNFIFLPRELYWSSTSAFSNTAYIANLCKIPVYITDYPRSFSVWIRPVHP